MSKPRPHDDSSWYSMRVVTRMTGLSADLIRAWERRYGAVEPERTDGNTRRFSQHDVRRLDLMRRATEQGHAIGSIATLGVDELESLVGPDRVVVTAMPDAFMDDDSLVRVVRNRYLEAVREFEPRKAWQLLQRAATVLEPRAVTFDLVLPLVQQVGAAWESGDMGVAQEHLITAHVRAIMSRLVLWGPSQPKPERVLLTTPEGHRHELGLLVGALAANARGFEVIYLGPDLPAEQIAWAVDEAGAELLVLSVVLDSGPEDSTRLSDEIRTFGQHADVWLGLPESHSLVAAAPDLRFFHRFEDFDVALADRAG